MTETILAVFFQTRCIYLLYLTCVSNCLHAAVTCSAAHLLTRVALCVSPVSVMAYVTNTKRKCVIISAQNMMVNDAVIFNFNLI